MTDGRFDFDELKAWEEKVRDPEVQRSLEEAWAAEGDDTVGDFKRERENVEEIADGLAGLLGGKRKKAKKNEDEASGASGGKRKKWEPHINKLRSLTEGVVEYRCRRGCVLAAAVPYKNGDAFLVWRGGKGVRLIDPETLQRWRDGGVPDSADADAVAEVLDNVKYFEDRCTGVVRYRTNSGREAAALGWEGKELPAQGELLSNLPPTGIIEVTCNDGPAVLRVGDVWEDLKSGKRNVILSK